jgi:ABC-type antimicrobial peptide transport system permease subunit
MAMLALRRNILRSLLTCLGIIIGVAAVIAIVEIGNGSAYAIQQAISTLGANVIQIDPADSSIGGVSTGVGGQITLTPADAEAVQEYCPAVLLAAPSVDCRTQVIYGNLNWSPRNILGTTPAYLTVRDWDDLDSGALFTDEDVRNSAPVCLIGQTPARELFKGESPLGKEVQIKNLRLKVLGVLKAKGANTAGFDQDDFFVVPWTTVKYRLSSTRTISTQAAAAPVASTNTPSQMYPDQQIQLYAQPSATKAQDSPQITRFADIDDLWVSAKSSEDVPVAISQITALLRERHHLEDGQPDDFNIRDLTEISEARTSTSRLMASLLLWVAFISLVVGGVGVMNIMLVSVTERTREIGLRMAVGARARDILLQFLIEAVLLCFTGGIVGILVGRGVSKAVTLLLHWPTLPSLYAVAVSVIVSVSVGVIFGYYPAWKASRLDPIDALRYE